MDRKRSSKAQRVVAWVCAIWGGLATLRLLLGLASGKMPDIGTAYGAGQAAGSILAVAIFAAGVYYIRKG